MHTQKVKSRSFGKENAMKTIKSLLVDFGANGKKLITVVIQDINTKEVLFAASTNRTAFMKTVESGEVWLYNRSQSCARRIQIRGLYHRNRPIDRRQ